MGKYADLFEPAAGQAKGKYADLFDTGPVPTYEPQVVTPDDISPTPGELSTLEAPEGSPAREEINRAVAGNIFAPPGAFAREPTLAELVQSALPQQPQEQVPLQPPLPEQGAFEQGGVLGATIPAIEAGGELVGGMIPHDLPSYLRQIYAPYAAFEQGRELARGDVSSIPFVGRVPEIIKAEETPGFSKERYMAALKTLMDVGLLAGAGAERPPSHLRTEPLQMPELHPSPTLGPGTIAADVSRALAKPEFERQFTMQPSPPEIAPAPPLAETLASIPNQQPLPFNPEIPATPVEPGAPIVSETARFTPEPPPIGTPLKPVPLHGPNGERAVDVAAAQQPQVAPEVPAPVTPVAAEVQVIPPEDVRYAGGEPPALEVQPETPTAPPAAEPVPQAYSDEPHVSAIANRFTAERAARGELGEVQPGGTISTMDLVHQGLKMTPEQVNESVSRVMHGGDVNTRDNMAIRGEEARLSQRSGDLSRAARANPDDVQAQLAADNAFKDLTDFHNGPVAAVKRNWHLQGKGMQGEIPVDLSTLNGMREAWLKDTGLPPPKSAEPVLQKTADKLAKAIDEERGATRRQHEEIERVTRGRKLPTPEELRAKVTEKMKVEPCIV